MGTLDNLADQSDDVDIFSGTETVDHSDTDWKKLKKAELVAFYAELPETVGEFSIDEFKALSAPKMRIFLAELFPSAEAKKQAKITGFDTADLVHKAVQEAVGIDDQTEATKVLLVLKEDISHNYFRVGAILQECLNQGWTFGEESFWDGVEKVLDLKKRKAEYYISIYTHVVDCGLKWGDFKDVGWSKMGLIAPHLTPENCHEWLQKARDAENYADLRNSIKAYKSGGKEGAEGSNESTPIKTIKIKVHEDQVETIESALSKAKEIGETEFDGPALEYMSLAFLNSDQDVDTVFPDTDEEEADTVLDVSALSAIYQRIRDENDDDEVALSKILDPLVEVFPNLALKVTIDDDDGVEVE